MLDFSVLSHEIAGIAGTDGKADFFVRDFPGRGMTWIATLSCPHPAGFPASWEDAARQVVIEDSVLRVPAVNGIRLDFSRARVLLEAAVMLRLRQAGLVPY